MNESKFAAEIIDYYTNHRDAEMDRLDVEVHYNHFGDRGVVDLVAEYGNVFQLFELKADPAIEDAAGANEIIRQFKRMEDYFFKDDSNTDPGKHIEYKLAFYPTELSLQHLNDNYSLYDSVTGSTSQRNRTGTRVEVSEVVLHDGHVELPVAQATIDQESGVRAFMDEDYPVTEFRRSFSR